MPIWLPPANNTGENTMSYRINLDKPTRNTFHISNSSLLTCQPQEKKISDGSWIFCQDDQVLLAKVREQHAATPHHRWHICRNCVPVIPSSVKELLGNLLDWTRRSYFSVGLSKSSIFDTRTTHLISYSIELKITALRKAKMSFSPHLGKTEDEIVTN